MKNFTILLCFLVGSVGFSQTIVEDFETPYAALGSPGSPFFNEIANSLTVQQVPDPAVGAARGTVLELITDAASAPWQGAGLTLQDDPIDLTDDPGDPDEKKVKIWVFSNTSTGILAKVTNGTGADSATDDYHDGLGWQELTFDFQNGKDNTGPANGIYSVIRFYPAWDLQSNGTCPNANCYPNFTSGGGGPDFTPVVTIYIDEIISPAGPPPSCTTTLGATSATCETANGTGAADDTYSATVDFSNGLNGNVYVVSANSGTVGGDDPNVVASGTITVTGITEGTNLTLTVSDVADGGDCDLSTIVTSPSCIPAPTLTVLEDFEEDVPTLVFQNGTGSATVVPDPTGALGNGDVLQIITNAAGSQPWQQAELTLQNEFLDLSTSDKSVFVEWYSDTPFDALLGVALAGGGAVATTEAAHTGTGWEILEFDFSSSAQNLSIPSGVYERLFFFPLWDISAGTFVGGAGSGTDSTTYVDVIQGPAITAPMCETVLGSSSAICDSTGPGATDDTYTATVNFTGGMSDNPYVVASTSGTVGGDDPNVVASGTITVTGITEGTDITVTVNSGLCSLSANILSPICVPSQPLDLLEDFEGASEITSTNGLGGANVITDPLDPGNNAVLEIISDAGGLSWQQANVIMQEFFMDVNATASFTVEVDVYATQDFTLLARLDDLVGPGPAATPTATSQDFVSGSGWQTLTFSFNQPEDLPGIADGQYSQIAFIPNWAGNGTGTSGVNPNYNDPTNFTLYVDNIRAVQGDLIPIVPQFYVYDNGTWAPSDPTGGNSGSIDDINIINGDVVISDDLECEDLTIQPGASMTIDSGVAVTTSTTTLFSTSSTFSSLILNGTMSGTINYHRFTTIVGINDLASPPLSGQTFGPFAGVNLNLPQQGDLRAYGPYDTVAGEYVNYDVVANAATVLESGVGYRAATIDGNRLIYEGTPLSTDVLDVPITDAIAGKAWNLIGNPYPSYMDFDTFFNANLSAFESDGAFLAIYGYDGNAVNGWKIWNLATIADNAVTELIAPGQGFFVKSAVGGGLVDYTTAMRRTGTSDDFIQGFTANNLDVALSELSLTSDSNVSSTSIYFIEGTTRSLDPGYDAGSYQGSAGEFSIFTNLVEDNEGLDMQIQTLPYNDFNDVVIPLGIKALAGTSLTIGLEENLNSPVPSNVNVYLEDTLLNTLTLLNTSEYTFTPSSDMIGTGRFFLRYSAETLSTVSSELDNMLIYADNANDNIVIKGQLTEKSNVILYDIHGRVILSQDLDNSNAVNTINVNSVSTGIYIVEISNGNTTATQKLVIK